MLQQKIGFIGSGQMARALARGLVEAGLIDPRQLSTHDPVATAIEQFRSEVSTAQVLPGNQAVVEASDMVVLAVKPQFLSEATRELETPVSPEKLFVSIVAGVTLSALQASLGTDRVIRVMPNTPCLVRRGASGYSPGSGATSEDCQLVGQLLDAVGISFQVNESLLDAVTGLSGSGPAYVFTMIEAMSDGGVRMGLPRPTSTALAVQTVLGAAELARSTQLHPALLRERVASPGGTTIAGLQVLEDRGVRAALLAAVQAATERSIELGQSS